MTEDEMQRLLDAMFQAENIQKLSPERRERLREAMQAATFGETVWPDGAARPDEEIAKLACQMSAGAFAMIETSKDTSINKARALRKLMMANRMACVLLEMKAEELEAEALQ